MIVGGKMVNFVHYRQKELWYKTECGFEFPVPIDDTGDAIFASTDKAILFMRWIKKHLDSIQKGYNETGV